MEDMGIYISASYQNNERARENGYCGSWVILDGGVSVLGMYTVTRRQALYAWDDRMIVWTSGGFD